MTAESFYSPEHRALQDAFDARALADTMEAMIVHPTLADDAVEFISSRDFFFLSTVNAQGEPTVSHKGGAPGFVKVLDPSTLAFPSYDGNGMYLSMGNIDATAKIGMLFIDLETPHRVRVQATARLAAVDDPIVEAFPGAELVVIATVTSSFVNCGRYIHRHERVATSVSVPDASGQQPLAAWKRIDALQPVLPAKDQGRADAEGGTISPADYDEGRRAGIA